METRKIEDISKGDLIKADLYSRVNAINGKYTVGQLGLDDLSDIKDTNLFYLETLKMKADLADKMIAEAESEGKNTSDSTVMKELGKEINSRGTPLHRSEAVMTAIFACIRLVLFFAIAIGIWGLVFGKSFLVFGFSGIIIGFLISLLSVGPVIAFQRTKEKVRDMSFGAGYMWGNLAIVVGVLGLVAFVIKLLFFN